jgi:hypothetical protein
VISRTFHGRDAGRFACPKWQGWMREKQPRLLVIYEKYEVSFDPSGPEAYRRDVPTAENRG